MNTELAPFRRIIAKKFDKLHGFEGWLLKLECNHVIFRACNKSEPVGRIAQCHLCLAKREGMWHE